jgi:hypothetical protein
MNRTPEWPMALGMAMIVTGVVLSVLGYAGVQGSSATVEQLSFLVSGGLAGLFLLCLGSALIVARSHRRALAGLEFGPGGPDRVGP